MSKFVHSLIILTLYVALNVSGQYDNGSEEEDATEATTQAATTQATTMRGNVTTPDPVHVIGQVNNILNNVETVNISGIVDQALGIRNNVPVRNLVNGIISTVFCNRWFAALSNCGAAGNPWNATDDGLTT